MINVATQKPLSVPSATELKRAARTLGISRFPELMRADMGDLKRIAAGRDDLIAALEPVPAEIQAWASDGVSEEVRRIAAVRKTSTDEENLWHGISDSARAAVGGRNAAELLFRAEKLVGRAEWDTKVADRLAEQSLEPDPALAQPIETLDLAANASAAADALQARRLIESAPEKATTATFDLPAINPRAPDEWRTELAGTDAHQDVSRCSAAITVRLANLDRRSISNLAATTANSLPGITLDPYLADFQRDLEQGRDDALRRGLAAARSFGRNPEDRAARDLGGAELKKLRTIDERLRGLPRIGELNGPLGADWVTAAVSDASGSLVRERLVERPAPDAGRDFT